MAVWYGYFGMEDVGLNPAQRAVLIAAIRALGTANDDPQPARRLHGRIRSNDNRAGIFEAVFNEDNLTVAKWKERLAGLFGVDPATVDHSISQHSFAGGNTPAVTFSRGGIDYLIIALFGGVGATWRQSWAECLGYIFVHLAEWEPLIS